MKVGGESHGSKLAQQRGDEKMRKGDLRNMSNAGRRFMLLCLVAVFSMAMYGCGGGGGGPAAPTPASPDRISAARMGAAEAAQMAMTAAMAARTAFTTIDTADHSGVGNPTYGPNHTRTSDAADDADEAYMTASNANTAAMAADVTADAAEEAERNAMTALAAARTALGEAEMYSGMIVEYTTEANALSDAKDAANDAAGKARMYATTAMGHAERVKELLGDNAEMATAAQGHADKADAAADDADTAAGNAAALSQGMSGDAETEQGTAEGKRDDAQMYAGLADGVRADAQAAADASSVQIIREKGLEAAGVAMEAEGHGTSARGKATLAAGQVTMATDAVSRAMKARTDHGKASEQATIAQTAATEAATAATAGEAAGVKAREYATMAANADNIDDAKMYLAMAQAQNAIATENHTGETGAGMASMRAMAAAELAEEYANTHVLGLFMQANAYDITTPIQDNPGTPDANEAMTVEQQQATKIASIGAAMMMAAEMLNGNQRGELGTTMAAWPGTLDRADTPDEDESAGNILTITIGDTESDTVGDPDADTPLKPNARTIAGVDGLMHGFDMANEQLRVIAFTDREQSVVAQDAVTAITYVNAAVAMTDHIVSLGASPDGGLTWPGSYNDGAGAVMGTFSCADPCSLVYTGTGDDVEITTATGLTFSGSRAGKDAVLVDTNMDYLLFGLWLDEDQGNDSFGAFGGGGQPFTANNVNGLTGTASYSGEAVGARHKTGSGVSWFEGDASLRADFDDADTAGTIEGSISNISVNGHAAMSTPINLVRSTISANTNTFSGTTVMGGQTRPGEALHSYNGTWSGGFFNNPAEDATGAAAHPGSVAGTFGVTRDTMEGEGDDAKTITESFVGAFGAHNTAQ